MSEVVVSPPVDRSLFSLHEEEDVVEVPPHRRQVFYFETNFRAERPERFVGANMAIYWIPGQRSKPWAGPDVFVALGPPVQPEPRVWVTWEDGPIQFVAEVASDRTRRQERKKREEIYQLELKVPESLYVDLDYRRLELWRLENGVYRRVRAVGGRLYSQELNLWFGWDRAGAVLVRVWTGEGRMLATPEEVQQQRLEAEERAQEERLRRREAEERAQEEQLRRREAEAHALGAEQQAREEQQQRLDAEQRAREAEARAAELAAELERLRRGSA